jgi:adenylate kinase
VNVHLVLLGAPGVGKGTQAVRIARSLELAHVSTGDLLRQLVREGTPRGLEVQKKIDKGHLVSDELACEMAERRLAKDDCKKGYVLDGFPRTVAQAKMLDTWHAAQNSPLEFALDLEVGDDEVVQRLSSRRICPACNGIYSLQMSPPKMAGICDSPECSGEKLVQRRDDEEATIRERLKIYREESEPLKKYYRSTNRLGVVTVAGLSPEHVFTKIEKSLRTFEEHGVLPGENGMVSA